MRIEERHDDGVAVLRVLERRVDASLADEFSEHLMSVIGRGRRMIVVDLAPVEFIDSRGIGVLLGAVNTLGRTGEIVVAGARDTVSSLFRLTRIDNILEMFPGESEAAAALRTRHGAGLHEPGTSA